MKNKVCFIVPYFGDFPSYFELFLKSCASNKEFKWLIITDNQKDYEYPENIRKIDLSFQDCKKIVQSKFDFSISLNNPKKLCDYKPAYGYIFDEYLTDFDFWGYCDIDLIFGNLSNFITDDLLNEYDRLFSLGHLSLYRNNRKINTMFMNKVNGHYKYKEVYQSDMNYVFDEWHRDSVNHIFLENNVPIYFKNVVADVAPYNYPFCLVYFDMENQKWINDNIKKCLFKWKNGKITGIWIDKDKIEEKEFMYVHIQKRNMIQKIHDINTTCFYIVPNKFLQFDEKKETYYIRKYKIHTIIDYKKINNSMQQMKDRVKTKIKVILKKLIR